MARTDTLTHYLTDIADAIRTKTGSSDPIQASSFDTAIENIPSGGGDIDWSEIGYSSAPDYFANAFNYAKEIYDNWDSSTTGIGYRYQNDKQLVIMPLIDTSNVTDMSSTFSGCANLKCVPLLNTSNVTYMNSTFSNCVNLESVPLFDTSKATNMANMFYNCGKLTSVPLFDTSKATNMNGMFTICQSLTSVPQFNTSNSTGFSTMFYNCSKLVSVPLLDAGKCETVSSIFDYSSNLENLGGLKDLGKAYSTSSAENNSPYTLNLSTNNKLTHDSLMNIINNLYDIKTKGCNNQKLQLGSTNLAKLTVEEIAIATNKGWNVS